MAKISCPACHIQATKVSLTNGYKYYCPYCGWNVEVARTALRSTIRKSYWMLGLAAAISLLALIGNRASWGIAAAVALAFGGLPAFWISRARHDLGRLGNVRKPAGAEAMPPASPTESQSWSLLTSLPRPRRLKLSWRGRAYALIALVGGPIALYWMTMDIREGLRLGGSDHSGAWSLAVAGAVVCFYMLRFVHARLRERRLLAEGATATGYVISQETNRYSQSIAYRFQDAGGRTFTARCADPSRSLYEGMTTPVFYDPNQPTQSIPLDCSLTKIVAQ